MNAPEKVEISDFQQRVYQALREIPKGRVITYRALADRIQCGSARAVGQALRHNPFAPTVPCHRVIKSDLTLGGFMGKTSGVDVRRKEELLRAEGVTFVKGHLQDKKRLIETGWDCFDNEQKR